MSVDHGIHNQFDPSERPIFLDVTPGMTVIVLHHLARFQLPSFTEKTPKALKALSCVHLKIKLKCLKRSSISDDRIIKKIS